MNAFADPDETLMTQTVQCAECGHKGHSLYTHINDAHGMTAEQYNAKHPGKPLLSAYAMKVQSGEISAAPAAARQLAPIDVSSMTAFGIGFGKAGDKDRPIRGYSNFTFDDGVPAIDPNYVFQKDATRDFLMVLAAGRQVYLSGPTGSGKTTLGEQFAARTGRPFYRQQFHREMEPVVVEGTWTVVEGGKFEYLYSGLALAMQQPSLICFDEYDSGNPATTAICNAILEGKPLVLPGKGGEKIYKHPDCLLMGTGNTNGMGDETGLYTSTTVQSFATMNRFDAFIPIDYLKAEDEVQLLTRLYGRSEKSPKGMPEQEIKDMVRIANMVREGFLGGMLSVVLSTRQLVSWGRWLSMTGDCSRSFNIAFANQLGKVDRGVVTNLYQKVYAR